jgi:S1-C subfamily serine protease
MRLVLAILALSALTAPAAAQEAGVLRISVVLVDEAGAATPIPRVQLLISDNPTSREPRRVRTGADGTVDVTLPPGNYTVESDAPTAFGGRSFAWTQTLDVPAGRDTSLQLTMANADIDAASAAPSGASGPSHADAAAMLNKWRASLVEIWSPARHATGFVIDARGLIATNDRTLGDATDVEVEFTGAAAADRIKVPGRVVATDRTQGVTLVWVNPATIASRPAIAPDCSAAPPPIEHDDKVVALIAPMLEPMNAILGTAMRPTSQSFRVDWRLEEGTTGGPVFRADGVAVGMTFGEEERDRERERRRESYVIPLTNACSVIAMAAPRLSGAAPPATPLRTEAGLARHRGRRVADPKAPQLQPPVISAANFDIALVTPAMVNSDAGTMSARSYFGYWMPYVGNAPQVLFVRVTPQFGESLWKTLARGAAATQGMNLPPLKSFNANFQRMRAYCGTTEVLPIHPFVIDMPLEGKNAVREGLYVFAQTDFGPHCGSVRFDMFSEKSPNKPDSRTIEPALFTRVAQQP